MTNIPELVRETTWGCRLLNLYFTAVGNPATISSLELRLRRTADSVVTHLRGSIIVMSIASEPNADASIAILELFPRQGEWREGDYFSLPGNRMVELVDGHVEILTDPGKYKYLQ